MINIQGFNLVTYVQKKEVIITSCYITPYCLYAYKILVLSYHICKSASMHPPQKHPMILTKLEYIRRDIHKY